MFDHKPEIIAIFGNGGMAREALMYAEKFYDNIVLISKENEGDYFSAYANRKTKYFIGIGSPKTKKNVARKCEEHNIYIPASYMLSYEVGRRGKGLVYGQGVILAPNVFLTCGVSIGSHTIVGIGVAVGHEARIGKFCQINPLVTISGGVEIKDGVLIGAGATILENRTIGENSIVGAGALVTKDIPDNEVWVGSPARKMKDKND